MTHSLFALLLIVIPIIIFASILATAIFRAPTQANLGADLQQEPGQGGGHNALTLLFYGASTPEQKMSSTSSTRVSRSNSMYRTPDDTLTQSDRNSVFSAGSA
jgi:hypothetical protein